jgi:hypothetical protein
MPTWYMHFIICFKFTNAVKDIMANFQLLQMEEDFHALNRITIFLYASEIASFLWESPRFLVDLNPL